MKKIFRFIIERYLKLLTKIIIYRKKPLIIAVAGSSNKTFIKNQILEEMKNEEGVRGNPRSFNTEIGLPLAVLFLPSGYSSIFKWVDVLLAGSYISIFKRDFPRVLVLEMGVSKKGDMKYLLSIIKPAIAVISDIGQNFSDNKNLIDQEMASLVASIPENGRVILNADYSRVRDLQKRSKAPVILYGKKEKAKVKISQVKEESGGQSFDLTLNKNKKHYKTESFGIHNVYASVAAKIVASEIKKIKKT
jgi:UDP-N-acetylmuramoyl-tripeptide--D-alanyl-D-alanine ligase